MCYILLYIVFSLGFGSITFARDADFLGPFGTPDPCDVEGPKGRVPWIIYVRDPDYGWRGHTHRANIALAVNNYAGTSEEIRKMGLQLEVEITRALFRSSTSAISDSDLALFIHALLATSKNPRNFHGTDLVADLLGRVNTARKVHPFLILALCNSNAVTFDHMYKLQSFLTNSQENDAEKAIALKAFACGADRGINKFKSEMKQAGKYLREKQSRTDGSFGNAYTTSLVVQALTATNDNNNNGWNEEGALEFLNKEAYIDVNLIKAYYIEMALNARKVKFIKDLYRGPPLLPVIPPERGAHYVQYTIRKELEPEVSYSITMNVPEQTNAFSIMEMSAKMSGEFRFNSYLNRDGRPMVFSVAGVPNDAEENRFWRLCHEYDVDHAKNTSKIATVNRSPVDLVPRADDHIVFWYLDTDCPVV